MHYCKCQCLGLIIHHTQLVGVSSLATVVYIFLSVTTAPTPVSHGPILHHLQLEEVQGQTTGYDCV